MKEHVDLVRVTLPVVTMFKKGWFDNAMGRLEGFEIFRELMPVKQGNAGMALVDSPCALVLMYPVQVISNGRPCGLTQPGI